ncbi:MAG TPA: metal-dependent transcriptional regulator [Desulfobacteraceae bacterium]|nr:metal-dependent transcriptional regulator [Desulfobacteraceae bacterium]
MEALISDYKDEKPLTAVMEDYLESIFTLSREKRIVRVRDIAKRLGVKMPTVTSMLKVLNDRGLIAYEKYEFLDLTDKGLSIGREINRRHRVLRNFLTDILKINIERSDEEACKMEHGISHFTLDRLVKFLEFIQDCSLSGSSLIDNFGEYILSEKRSEEI